MSRGFEDSSEMAEHLSREIDNAVNVKDQLESSATSGETANYIYKTVFKGRFNKIPAAVATDSLMRYVFEDQQSDPLNTLNENIEIKKYAEETGEDIITEQISNGISAIANVE